MGEVPSPSFNPVWNWKRTLMMQENKYTEKEYRDSTEKWCGILTEDFRTEKQWIYPTMLVMKYVIILILMPLALVMYSDKRLRKHPGLLIARIALCQGAMVQFMYEEAYCQYKHYEWFTWSISPFLDFDSYKVAHWNWAIFNTLNFVQKLAQRSFIILMLSLAICISLDLRFVVVNPLYPENRRMIVYNLICVTMLVVFNITYYSLTDTYT